MLPSLEAAPILPLCPTGTAPSPTAAAAMDEALGQPDIVGSIVERVAAGNVKGGAMAGQLPLVPLPLARSSLAVAAPAASARPLPPVAATRAFSLHRWRL